jgi:polar amino acid transport system permease protein
MTVPVADAVTPEPTGVDENWRSGEFPWWLVVLALIIGWLGYQVFFNPEYTGARTFIFPGIIVTIRVTAIAFALSALLGLLLGMGRLSHVRLVREACTAYVEFIRGLPMVVLILLVAFVAIPSVTDALGIENRLPNESRAIIALTLIYAGYLAEVYRAGIQSVDSGQSEAGRSLGLSQRQTMFSIVLPQAVRNVLPALGNDLISMLKDSALLTVVAVSEITHLSRLYSGSSFQFAEAYLTITFLYLTGTLLLSLAVRGVERVLERG